MILSCKVENFQGDVIRKYRSSVYRTDLLLSKIQYSSTKSSSISKYLTSYFGEEIKNRRIIVILMYSQNPAIPGPYMFRLLSPF